MLWNEVVSNGLVVTGVLVRVSQIVFVSKVPKCLESAEMQGEDGKFGSWEICRGMYFPTSQSLLGKLGNWEMITGTYLPISQIIPAKMAQRYVGNWEIGKSVEVYTSQFPK